MVDGTKYNRVGEPEKRTIRWTYICIYRLKTLKNMFVLNQCHTCKTVGIINSLLMIRFAKRFLVIFKLKSEEIKNLGSSVHKIALMRKRIFVWQTYIDYFTIINANSEPTVFLDLTR